MEKKKIIEYYEGNVNVLRCGGKKIDSNLSSNGDGIELRAQTVNQNASNI